MSEWNYRMSGWLDDVCEDVPIPKQVLAYRLRGLIEEFLTTVQRTDKSERETPHKAA